MQHRTWVQIVGRRRPTNTICKRMWPKQSVENNQPKLRYHTTETPLSAMMRGGTHTVTGCVGCEEMSSDGADEGVRPMTSIEDTSTQSGTANLGHWAFQCSPMTTTAAMWVCTEAPDGHNCCGHVANIPATATQTIPLRRSTTNLPEPPPWRQQGRSLHKRVCRTSPGRFSVPPATGDITERPAQGFCTGAPPHGAKGVICLHPATKRRTMSPGLMFESSPQVKSVCSAMFE